MSTDKGEIEELSLDKSLDDIEDLPGFGIPLTGAYRVTVENTDAEKEINNKKAIEFNFKIEEVCEMSEEPADGEKPPIPGDVFSAMWFRNNKFAMGRFKEIAIPIAKAIGVNSIGAVVSGAKGMQLLVVIKRKKDKNDPDIHRMEIKKVAVI